ncbi:twin-arginine translocase subunit TatB [Chitinibacter bivalviorum]|uniref:Sec-independent protein translocase protein TatB n=1 Tax=Chitinibacter bivalviorum TaxID=2739434 RepID=A0A7H9BJI7_9NEIS|nr:Sec-independent protein translocase protein TatB [Chitinibacter bivalviorum]QLG88837.1 twin-arginine translocase subunit TatB [Chitinibacter bivalviorum]
MFDISLGELLVIGAVTLVVVGPEKMPKVARTAGMLFGRLQRFVNTVKGDLQREMQASELAQIQKEIEAEAAEIKNTIHQPMAETRQAFADLEANFQATLSSEQAAVAAETTPSTAAQPSIAVAETPTTAEPEPALSPQVNLPTAEPSAQPDSSGEPPAKVKSKSAHADKTADLHEEQLDLFADLNETSPLPSDRR